MWSLIFTNGFQFYNCLHQRASELMYGKHESIIGIKKFIKQNTETQVDFDVDFNWYLRIFKENQSKI